MRQVQSETYSVAWFALAECVSRGEKERALGVYRLLSHSITDQAFRAQLEADILWAFNDSDAIDKYQAAAALYKKEGRLLQATTIVAHIVEIKPDNLSYLHELIALHRASGNMEQLITSAVQYITVACQKKDVYKALDCMHQIEADIDGASAGSVYQQLVFVLFKQEGASHEALSGYIKKTIDAFLVHSQSKALQTFLSKLQAMSSCLYQQACYYIENDDTAH